MTDLLSELQSLDDAGQLKLAGRERDVSADAENGELEEALPRRLQQLARWALLIG